MAFAQGSRSQVAYIAETVFGTTPATPTLIAIPNVSFNINMVRTDYVDTSIRADRMTRYSLTGTRTVTGDFSTLLSHNNFDPFIASAMNSTWATNVLKTGTTQQSFSIEQGQLDISAYSLYTGCTVDKLTITVPTNAPVTSQFTVVGKDQILSSTTAATTLTPATANQPYTHLGGSIKEGGTVVADISALTLDISNTLTANLVLGSATSPALSFGMSAVTGTVTAFFDTIALYNKFMNATMSSLDFTLSDGTNTMEFLIPNLKYTATTKSISGTGSVMLAINFTALYDATTSSNLVITRST